MRAPLPNHTFFVKIAFVCLSFFLISSLDNDTSASQAQQWNANLKGNILEITYGSDNDFPQYAALHLDSSYFRLNYGPESSWGTSVILLPAFWENGEYFQGGPVTASWKSVGSNFLISISGVLSGLSVHGKVLIHPPDKTSISTKVTMDVAGNIDLDDRPGEAFKPVMLSSMYISANIWDTQMAFVDSTPYLIPLSGWITDPPVVGTEFGLTGGTSNWKNNAPTIKVTLKDKMKITGWVTPSNDPNDDNVGFWAASDQVMASWYYMIIARP